MSVCPRDNGGVMDDSLSTKKELLEKHPNLKRVLEIVKSSIDLKNIIEASGSENVDPNLKQKSPKGPNVPAVSVENDSREKNASIDMVDTAGPEVSTRSSGSMEKEAKITKQSVFSPGRTGLPVEFVPNGMKVHSTAPTQTTQPKNPRDTVSVIQLHNKASQRMLQHAFLDILKNDVKLVTPKKPSEVLKEQVRKAVAEDEQQPKTPTAAACQLKKAILSPSKHIMMNNLTMDKQSQTSAINGIDEIDHIVHSFPSLNLSLTPTKGPAQSPAPRGKGRGLFARPLLQE